MLRKETGRAGEQMAVDWLVNQGWRIIERNWSSSLGEIDIIAWDKSELVFVEVRTTNGDRFGQGFQSVDKRKQQRIRRLATQYIQQHQLQNRPTRLDVMSIRLDQQQIEHIPGAF